MAFYKVNRPSKDPIYQNKGLKHIESFRPSNRRRKPDRGSNYNMYLEKDEEAFKDVETKLESDLDLELESFTCVIRNFDLDDSKSSCFIDSLNSKNSAKDSETEGGYLATFNKSKKLLERSPNKPDLLLYDIGTTNHIDNDRKWFRDDYIPNKGQLRTLKIRGGPVIFKGSGTAVFIVLSYVNPLKYRKVIFEDVLYLSDVNVNLFSGLKHYKSGGCLKKNRICTLQGGIIARLNIVKTGFFIPLKGHKNSSVFVNFCYSFYKDDFYIFIPVKPLKAGLNKPNVLEKITPKSGPHKPKDRQRSEVSKGVNTGNNSFKNPSSWESTEGGPCMPEDKPCKLVES